MRIPSSPWTGALAVAGALVIALPTTATAQMGDGPWLVCGVPGLAAKAGVDTGTYVNRPGISKPAWLNGETLVVERFPGAPGRAPGTLAFVMERTTFAPPGTITRTDSGKGDLGTYASSVPAHHTTRRPRARPTARAPTSRGQTSPGHAWPVPTCRRPT